MPAGSGYTRWSRSWAHGSVRKWPRISGFGHSHEPLGLAPHDEEHDDNGHHGHATKGEVDRARCAAEGVAGKIGNKGIDGRPQDAAGRVGHKEVRPAHFVGASQKGGVRPKDRDEAPKEDDLAAVAVNAYRPTFIFASSICTFGP